MKVADIELSTGLRMQFAEAGSGGRPLLLVHGFTGAKEDFTEWLDQLADLGWHAVAPDHRGHGESGKDTPRDDYSFELLASDVIALADARFGPEARFVLLGHSMGGMVAQVVASRIPDRLDGLVLMDTAHGRISIADPARVQQIVSIVEDRGVGGFADLMATRDDPMATPAHRRVIEERDGYAEFADRKLRSTAANAFTGMLLAIANAESRLDALKSLTVPTLVIVGEQDTPMLEASREMVEAIPGAELAVIDDGGHSPQFESPDEWWRALSGFLASLPDAASSGSVAPAAS